MLGDKNEYWGNVKENIHVLELKWLKIITFSSSTEDIKDTIQYTILKAAMK